MRLCSLLLFIASYSILDAQQPTFWSGGGGGGGGSGTVQNVATSCGIGGGPITVTGTVTGQILIDSQVGAGSFAIPSGDCGKQVNRNQAAAVSDTIAQAGGSFPAAWFVLYQCRGSGGCTITPTTSQIDGSANIVLVQNQGITIISDGTNYFTQGVRNLPMSGLVSAFPGVHTVNNGDATQVWNCFLTTPSNNCFIIGENTASTATGSPILFDIQTLATSTAIPFQVTARGTANGFRADVNGNLVGIGTNSFSTPGSVTSGSGGSVSGSYQCAQGTAATVNANSFGWTCPTTMTTSVLLQSPNAVPVAGQVMRMGTPASNIAPFTYIDHPEVLDIPAANCNNATGAAGWSLPASAAPTASCRAGTNNLGGVLQFADANNAQFDIEIPGDADLTSGNYPYIKLFFTDGANTSGTEIFQAQVSCYVSDFSATDDVAFAAAQVFSTRTATAANRSGSENLQFNSTSMTGCVAGGSMIVKITRNTDTAASVVNVSKATVTIPRLLTVQAN